MFCQLRVAVTPLDKKFSRRTQSTPDTTGNDAPSRSTQVIKSQNLALLKASNTYVVFLKNL